MRTICDVTGCPNEIRSVGHFHVRARRTNRGTWGVYRNHHNAFGSGYTTGRSDARYFGDNQEAAERYAIEWQVRLFSEALDKVRES